MADPGFFEILNTTRAIKRLKPDPVPPSPTDARPGGERRKDLRRQRAGYSWKAPGCRVELGRAPDLGVSAIARRRSL